MSARRAYGSGSLTIRREATGREMWIGQWRVGDRRVKRRLGVRRASGSRDGLTRAQAEKEMRRLMESELALMPAVRLELLEAGERYLRHLGDVMERKPTTLQDYGIILRKRLGPFFAGRALEKIDADLVGAYRAQQLRAGLAPKTVQNHLAFLHGVFAHAVRREWANTNPVAALERPPQKGPDPDIQYLEPAELELVLRAAANPADRVLFLTAALTGLRQGELLALRWRDVDWTAGVVRVRRSYTRGAMSAPKSRRSSRAVPIADRLGAELERHFQASRFQEDDHLVFAHPELGTPRDASKLRKRFAEAVTTAGVRPIRFHGLRHTFGTQMAAAGAPLRAIQEWMGHRDHKTTQIYADYAPDPSHGRKWAERAFGGAASGESSVPADGSPTGIG